MDGMRKCFRREFSDIYVFNLRGNARTSGGLRRKEKLSIIKNFKSVSNEQMQWQQIVPNLKEDWINQRDGLFDTLILIGDKKDKNAKTVFENVYSRGLATGQDDVLTNYCKIELEEEIKSCIAHYENVRKNENNSVKSNLNFNREIQNRLKRNKEIVFNDDKYFDYHYRPFVKLNVYYEELLVDMSYQLRNLFPTPKHENLVIVVQGTGGKENMPLITNCIPDLHLNGDSQCFPLYYYTEQKTENEGTLFDGVDGSEKYIRKDGVTDWILEELKARYVASSKSRTITKEHIFYYVYGLLHSKDYRARFRDDLKKSLPRLPIEKASGNEYIFYAVEDKMRYAKKRDKNGKSVADKTQILYNSYVRISNIPQKAYENIVNGKSALDWLMERYCVFRDKAGGITNNANLWAAEHGKPRHILDLILSIINVSCQTVDIVNALPRLDFAEKRESLQYEIPSGYGDLLVADSGGKNN